jgi:hypothetical protein
MIQELNLSRIIYESSNVLHTLQGPDRPYSHENVALCPNRIYLFVTLDSFESFQSSFDATKQPIADIISPFLESPLNRVGFVHYGEDVRSGFLLNEIGDKDSPAAKLQCLHQVPFTSAVETTAPNKAVSWAIAAF